MHLCSHIFNITVLFCSCSDNGEHEEEEKPNKSKIVNALWCWTEQFFKWSSKWTHLADHNNFGFYSSNLIILFSYSDVGKKKMLQKFIFSATLTLPKSFKKKGKQKNITSGEALGNSRFLF